MQILASLENRRHVGCYHHNYRTYCGPASREHKIGYINSPFPGCEAEQSIHTHNVALWRIFILASTKFSEPVEHPADRFRDPNLPDWSNISSVGGFCPQDVLHPQRARSQGLGVFFVFPRLPSDFGCVVVFPWRISRGMLCVEDGCVDKCVYLRPV